MGWLPVLVSGVAAFLLFKTGHTFLMVGAIVNVVGCFWLWGVLHNYATDHAKRRPDYSGRFYDITKREANADLERIAAIHLIFSLIGLAPLITGSVFLGTEPYPGWSSYE